MISMIRGMDPYTIKRLKEKEIISYTQIVRLSSTEIDDIEEEFDILVASIGSAGNTKPSN